MNLSTLDISPEDAAERLKAYEAQLASERTDLWSVIATWDLTELERAVLAARSEA